MAGVKPYTGIMDAVTMIVREEGAFGLYKGTPLSEQDCLLGLTHAHILQVCPVKKSPEGLNRPDRPIVLVNRRLDI